MKPDEYPSTDWETYMQQIERRLEVLLGLVKSRDTQDSSGLRRAIMDKIVEFELFFNRPTR